MTPAAQADPAAELEALPRKPVSDLKREGWRGIMRSVGPAGRLVMTNHDQPEAVILSLAAFRQLSEQAGRAALEDQRKLERLSSAFDDELAMLQQADAGDRLRKAFAKPLRLGGKLIAGKRF